MGAQVSAPVSAKTRFRLYRAICEARRAERMAQARYDAARAMIPALGPVQLGRVRATLAAATDALELCKMKQWEFVREDPGVTNHAIRRFVERVLGVADEQLGAEGLSDAAFVAHLDEAYGIPRVRLARAILTPLLCAEILARPVGRMAMDAYFDAIVSWGVVVTIKHNKEEWGWKTSNGF